MLAFVLDHIFIFSGAGIGTIGIACIAFEIFVPGSIPLIRTALGVVMKGLQWLIGTTAGAFVLVAAAAFLVGFWTHSAWDRSADLQKQLEAQVQATAAAQAAADRARHQAVALNLINAAASRRADAAEDAAADDDEQVSDLKAAIAADDKAARAAKTVVRSFALSAGDIALIAKVGAPRAAKAP